MFVSATRLLAPRYITALRYMPQLTLTGHGANKQLSISPKKPTTSFTTRNYVSRATGSVDLRALHKDEEDMAAASKSRAKAKAEGKSVPMAEHEGHEEVQKKQHDDAHVKEDDSPKGQPGKAKKRSRSPEGGGVAGSRDTKRQKNAYEISEYELRGPDRAHDQRAKSRRPRTRRGWTRTRHWTSCSASWRRRRARWTRAKVWCTGCACRISEVSPITAVRTALTRSRRQHGTRYGRREGQAARRARCRLIRCLAKRLRVA